MRHLTIIFIVSLLLSACSLYHLDAQDLTMDYYPPKASIDDVGYVPQASGSYVLIGKAIANAERRQLESGEAIRKLKTEAAKLGGDAITNIETDATGAWKRLPAQRLLGNAFVRANFRADVIVFK